MLGTGILCFCDRALRGRTSKEFGLCLSRNRAEPVGGRAVAKVAGGVVAPGKRHPGSTGPLGRSYPVHPVSRASTREAPSRVGGAPLRRTLHVRRRRLCPLE